MSLTQQFEEMKRLLGEDEVQMRALLAQMARKHEENQRYISSLSEELRWVKPEPKQNNLPSTAVPQKWLNNDPNCD